jgi:hypothetical protein
MKAAFDHTDAQASHSGNFGQRHLFFVPHQKYLSLLFGESMHSIPDTF